MHCLFLVYFRWYLDLKHCYTNSLNALSLSCLLQLILSFKALLYQLSKCIASFLFTSIKSVLQFKREVIIVCTCSLYVSYELFYLTPVLSVFLCYCNYIIFPLLYSPLTCIIVSSTTAASVLPLNNHLYVLGTAILLMKYWYTVHWQ